MNSLSHLYVAAHLDEMLKGASSERLAPSPPSRPLVQLASVLRAAWSLLTGPADRPMQLPSLTHDPYRA